VEGRWKLVWAGWVIYFAVAERQALKSKDPRAPLSYFLRHTLGIPRSPVHRRAGQVAFGAGIVWLVAHLYERGVDDTGKTDID
jgi:hypothetical protein